MYECLVGAKFTADVVHSAKLVGNEITFDAKLTDARQVITAYVMCDAIGSSIICHYFYTTADFD